MLAMEDVGKRFTELTNVCLHPVEFAQSLNESERMFGLSLVVLSVSAYISWDQLHLLPSRTWVWVKQHFFSFIKSVPYVKKKLDEELSKGRKAIVQDLHGQDKTASSISTLPQRGLSCDELVELADLYDNMESFNYQDGRCSGAVFSEENDVEEIKMLKEVFARFAWSNPLWPKLFPAVRKMEAEVVRMTANLMHGDKDTCGTMSTGGSMSILLAVYAHRNRAYARGVRHPEMILPASAHAAFYKAAEMFNIRIIEIREDPKTFTVDVKKVKSAISSRTALIVGSAPNFPYGTIDDIAALGQLAVKYDIPLHVDACLGGFLLPFIDQQKYNIPAFDFRVPGVASISADTHKYGLTTKGSSVVLYRNKSYIRHQYFTLTDWQGGVYASSTFEGSRAGMNIALCWASLLYHGHDNYERTSTAVVETTRRIREGIASIPQLKLNGRSDICIVSFSSDSINMHRFCALMEERHWHLSQLQFPVGLHIMVTLNHTKPGVAEKLIADCREIAQQIADTPNEQLSGQAAMYGMMVKIPDRSIIKDFASMYLDVSYELPEKS